MAAVGPALVVGGKVISGIGSIVSLIGTLTGVLGISAGALGGIVLAIAAVIAIGVLLYKNWDTIKEKAAELWQGVTEKFEAIKETVSEGWNKIKDTTTAAVTAVRENVNGRLDEIRASYERHGGGVSGVVGAYMDTVAGLYRSAYDIINNLTGGRLGDVVTTIQDKMTAAYTAVSSKFESIRQSIIDKLNAARDGVRNAIEAIKGFFNFEWSLPHIKLPHFSISGSFSLDPPSIPHIGVSWYARGAVLNAPTIFGYDLGSGTALGGGEAGPEAVAPIRTLQAYIQDAVREQSNETAAAIDRRFDQLLELLESYFPSFERGLVLDGGKLISVTAEGYDVEFGRRNRRRR